MADGKAVKKVAHKNRRKARKPKFIEVDGHQLTPAQHARYQRCVQDRTSPDRSAAQAHYLGLSDFLHTHRPSAKISDQLLDITGGMTSISLAIGKMREYMWLSPESLVREAGSDLVEKLAYELYNAALKLTAIARNVKVEKTTHLQDWLRFDEYVARIGCGAEVAHV